MKLFYLKNEIKFLQWATPAPWKHLVPSVAGNQSGAPKESRRPFGPAGAEHLLFVSLLPPFVTE